jgi:hypothetical protein
LVDFLIIGVGAWDFEAKVYTLVMVSCWFRRLPAQPLLDVACREAGPARALLVIRSVEMHGAGVSFYLPTVPDMKGIGKLKHKISAVLHAPIFTPAAICYSALFLAWLC